ncbi:MAG: hypothetical protein GY861_00615 [bacterium]|nr:hypothetical protein [bacterium]
MIHRKRAQSGGSAALLVLVIGSFIVLYLLFIPPDERNEILGNNDSDDNGGTSAEKASGVVLKESPGTLYTVKNDKMEHRVDPVNIFTKKEDVVMKSLDSIYVESSGSDDTIKNIVLMIEPEKTENAQLSFSVTDHRGRLVIMQNDEEIFNGEVSGAIEPLRLNGLQQENIIQFKASDSGWAPWNKNFYEISQIKITGTIDDIENKEAKETFYLTREEVNNVETAYLIYFVECKLDTVGRLRVYLNNELISSSVPDCGSPVKKYVDPHTLRTGVNEIKFFSEAGSYLVDQIFIKTELEEPITPIYYFELNDSQYGYVQNETLELMLDLKFADDDEDKRADLSINGHKTYVDTREDTYSKDISVYAEEDNNYVRIEPKTTLHLVEIKVELV